MNIPQIMGLRFTTPLTEQKTQNNNTPRFGLKMTKPLSQDTVSFGATAKMLTSRTEGISLQVASVILTVLAFGKSFAYQRRCFLIYNVSQSSL